jgi:uncharacterized YccA/Bax inhibitor family protein
MFKNTNPVFSKVRRDTSDQAISYGASYQGVILKTGLLFLLIVASAFGSYFLLAKASFEVYIAGLVISSIVAFISVFIASLSPRLAMPFSILYALAEGFLLGFIVLVYTYAFPNDNIAGLAILITLGIFAGMLVLYSTKLIVVTSRFRRVMLGVTFAILFSFLFVGIASLFDGGRLSYTLFGNPNSGLVLFIALLLVLYGAFMLVMSFDDARNIVSMGADKKYEWVVSLGLVVSTIYIFIQVLRLLAILASRKD